MKYPATIEVEFGAAFDGAPWSAAASLRKMRVGPRGLLGLLRGQLGLERPQVSEVVRTAEYLRALTLTAPRWCADSMSVDAWGTAEVLLGLRDDMVAGGWTPGTLSEQQLRGQPRLSSIQSVEETLLLSGGLSPGYADELLELTRALQGLERWPLGIGKVTIRSAELNQPHLWPEIFTALRRLGVNVEHAGPPAGRADLTIVSCTNEFTAAVTAAKSMAVLGSSAIGGVRQVLATSPTLPLDMELEARGLPAIGVSDMSSLQPRFQLLSLVLRLRFRQGVTHPVDPHLAYRLLGSGVFSWKVSRELRRALIDAPSVEGAAFQKKMDEIETTGDAAAAGQVASLRKLFALAHDASTDTVRQAYQVGEWFKETLALSPHADVLVMEQVRAFLAVLDFFPEESVGVLTERLILYLSTAVVEVRPSVPSAQASPWTVVTAPAQVFPQHTGTTVWWGATSGTTRQGAVWDEIEMQVLRSAGVRVESAAASAKRETAEAVEAMRAVGPLVAFVSQRVGGEPTMEHPILSYLESGQSAADLTVSADEYLQRLRLAHGPLTGETTTTLQDPPEWVLTSGDPIEGDRQMEDIPKPARRRQLLGGITAPVQVVNPDLAQWLLPGHLSPSSAEALLECSLCWVLQRRMYIEPSDSGLPTGNQLIGTLAHAVVEDLITQPDLRTEQSIRRLLVKKAADQASELIQPSRVAIFEGIQRVATASILDIFAWAEHHGVVFEEAEAKFSLSGAFSNRDIMFTGYRDLTGRVTTTGKKVVVDLKWTNSKNRFSSLYGDGRATQLAAYLWSISDGGTNWNSTAGYYLLKQKKPVPGGWDPSEVEENSMRHLWSRYSKSVSERLQLLSRGIVPSLPGQMVLAGEQNPSKESGAFSSEYDKEFKNSSAEHYYNAVTKGCCRYSDTAIFCGGGSF